jgi:hypothetical protein
LRLEYCLRNPADGSSPRGFRNANPDNWCDGFEALEELAFHPKKIALRQSRDNQGDF